MCENCERDPDGKLIGAVISEAESAQRWLSSHGERLAANSETALFGVAMLGYGVRLKLALEEWDKAHAEEASPSFPLS